MIKLLTYDVSEAEEKCNVCGFKSVTVMSDASKNSALSRVEFIDESEIPA